MFALHETTRKYICRIAFLALCVVPTLVTAWWIAGHHWPGRKGRLARELSESLDVHVKLADWRTPRPRVIRTRGVSLSDLASAHLLTELKTVEVRGSASARTYSIDEATIEAAHLERIAEKVFAWIGKLPPQVHEIQCGKLVIKLASKADRSAEGDAASEFVLHNIRGRIDRDATGRTRVQVIAQADPSAAANAACVRLTLTPSADHANVAPTLSFDTVGMAVPAEVLGSVPGLGSLGAEAQFSGVVRWTVDQPDAEGMAQGRLEAVDLSKVLPADSPHALRGAAVVELQELRWRATRIERIVGTVNARHAQISRSLVDAATSAAGFQCRQAADGVPVAGEPSMVSLDLLALRFQLGREGLTFWGHCPAEAGMPEGCMAVSGMQPLLLAPPYYDWPLGVLVQTLSARPTAWVPATRSAVDWSSRLPLPLK